MCVWNLPWTSSKFNPLVFTVAKGLISQVKYHCTLQNDCILFSETGACRSTGVPLYLQQLFQLSRRYPGHSERWISFRELILEDIMDRLHQQNGTSTVFEGGSRPNDDGGEGGYVADPIKHGGRYNPVWIFFVLSDWVFEKLILAV